MLSSYKHYTNLYTIFQFDCKNAPDEDLLESWHPSRSRSCSHPLENEWKLKHSSSSPAQAFPSSAPLTLETVCFRASHQKAADQPMQPSVAASDDCCNFCSCSAVCKVFVKKRERMEIQRAKNKLCDE